jgi:hypothetical protein
MSLLRSNTTARRHLVLDRAARSTSLARTPGLVRRAQFRPDGGGARFEGTGLGISVHSSEQVGVDVEIAGQLERPLVRPRSRIATDRFKEASTSACLPSAL